MRRRQLLLLFDVYGALAHPLLRSELNCRLHIVGGVTSCATLFPSSP